MDLGKTDKDFVSEGDEQCIEAIDALNFGFALHISGMRKQALTRRLCLHKGSQSDTSISTIHFGGRRHNFKDVMDGLEFHHVQKACPEWSLEY
uniref:Uncharacterized protein n=1 Tax=Solanum lycopersicum TaxID=4081 RepID=A0A3Q7JHQ4_SOLLC